MSDLHAVTEKEDTETKRYILTPENDDCVYQTEQWNNMISTGKRVRYEITSDLNAGIFEVDLTNKEREELLSKQEIIVNELPGAMCQEVGRGWAYEEQIIDKEKYTAEELKEIHLLLYLDPENRDDYDSECQDDVDETILEQNDWSMDETIYTITNGCVLEE